MGNKVIAMADDEVVFHWIIKKHVELIDSNCEILSFFNGDEVIEHLSSSPDLVPDILFLDLNMPVCDGWKFLEAYSNSSHKKKMDIYIISSSINPDDKKKASKFKMVNDFVSKPISNDFLEEALRKCG